MLSIYSDPAIDMYNDPDIDIYNDPAIDIYNDPAIDCKRSDALKVLLNTPIPRISEINTLDALGIYFLFSALKVYVTITIQ